MVNGNGRRRSDGSDLRRVDTLGSGRRATCVVMLAAIVASLATLRLRAGEREVVIFESPEIPLAGGRLSIVGDLLELGAGNLERSVDLLPRPDGTGSRVAVSLPVNSDYAYESYRRGLYGCTNLKGFVLATVNGATATHDGPILSKTLYFHSSVRDPVCRWRRGAEPFHAQPMVAAGQGRTAEETRWLASGMGPAGGQLELYIESADGQERIPASGSILTLLEIALLQDGELYSYVPAPQVSPGRLELRQSLSSIFLGQVRPYRVFLPRGYDEHTDRRYPVLYLHDGDGYFPADPGQRTLKAVTGQGRAAEHIVVGIDQASTRLSDLGPPGENVDGSIGRGDVYTRFLLDELKPIIDAAFRTLPDAEHTGTAGFSLGGLLAVYQAWEFSDHFSRAGSQSGSFWLPLWVGEMRREPKPPIRVYLDSGDVNDNYESTISVRNDFLGRAENPFVLEGDLRYVHACGQTHDFTPVVTRLDEMLEFLFPATEDAPTLPVTKHPLARFMVQALCSRLDTGVCFDGSSSLTPEGTALARYTWDFGDGATSEDVNACHTYAAPGSYWVTLGVKNDLDLESRASRKVCIGCWSSDELGPWTAEDVGTFGIAGGTRPLVAGDGSSFEACAGGRPLSGAADSIHFVHQALTGDGVVTLHAGQVGGQIWQLGIMMRAGLASDAVNVALTLYKSATFPTPRLRLTYRSQAGRPSRAVTGPEMDGGDFWLRLERRGSQWNGQGSADGVTWSDPLNVDLSLPDPVEVGFVAAGSESAAAELSDAIVQAKVLLLEVGPPGSPEPSFARGDANGDGEIDLSDPVFVLGFKFLGTPAPGCLDAADINDSGEIDISDAIYGLDFLFGGGPEPLLPYPDCGIDPTIETPPLGCDAPPDGCN